MSLINRRIFIVEDNLQNRAIMQMLLEQSNATVAFERWGVEVISKLQAFMPVDIILLDLMLPNQVSGFDIFDQIRALDKFSTVPIVAVSAMDAAVAVPKAREKGFAGFISKPINYESFAYQIEVILAGGQVWHNREIKPTTKGTS
jgi:CheY-like chemotaxis protein